MAKSRATNIALVAPVLDIWQANEVLPSATEEVSDWITTSLLSEFAGIDTRTVRAAATLCLNGKTWRGAALKVRYEGRALQVYGPSLPPDLREKWHKRYKTELAADIPAPVTLPAPSAYDTDAGKRFAEIRWKLELLSPALAHLPRSHARGKALRELAEKEHTKPDGKRIKLAYNTLSEWLRKLETQGESTLPRKRRAKKGPRVIVNRAWDSTCPLSDDDKKRIAEDLKTYIKSEWRSGVPGVYRVKDFASSKLVELCRTAGWADANFKTCDVGRYFAEQFREWSLVAMKERNAKEFFDIRTPRIKINRKKLKPGDVVVGDVHPFDVAKAEDGRTVHARLISWLDLATYDIFVTVVILAPGRGIRQEDIARSFVDMVQAWGLPKQLRLDNGKEYKWDAMMEGFNTLAGLVRDFGLLFLPGLCADGEKAELLDGFTFEPRNSVSRARPYNAPAKQIESVFGILEYQFFSLMPGWIGGDRMNKRTHKVGEAPKAHEGTNQEFLRDITICLDLYRNTEQEDGSSPYGKRRTAYEAGLRPVTASPEVFLFAFSEVRQFTVHTGGINVDGEWGMCDALIPLIGRKVEIRVAKWDRTHTFFQDIEGKMHAIPMGRTFDHDNPDGAKEQGRLTKVQNEHIRELGAAVPKLDLMAEATRHLSHMPPPPQLPEGIRITTTESAAIAAALETITAPAPKRLLPGESIHPTTGARLKVSSPPKEQRPDAKPLTPGHRPDLPPPLPPPTPKEPSNQVPTKFDLLKNLQPVAKPT